MIWAITERKTVGVLTIFMFHTLKLTFSSNILNEQV